MSFHIKLDMNFGVDRFKQKPSPLSFEFSIITTTVDEEFAMPLDASSTINATVDWGDGTVNTVTSFDDVNASHTYATPGEHFITVTGVINGWENGLAPAPHSLQMKNISKWGPFEISTGAPFAFNSNLTITATDAPSITSTTLRGAFYSCEQFDELPPGFNTWDFSSLTASDAFGFLFGETTGLVSADLSGIQLNSTVGASNMFINSTVETIDCSNVKFGKSPFSFQGLDVVSIDFTNSDTSTCTNMASVFTGCLNLTDLDLSSWDTSNVTNILNIFGTTRLDYLNISNWDLSSIPYANPSVPNDGVYTAGMFMDSITQNLIAENVTPGPVAARNIFGSFYSGRPPGQFPGGLDLSTWNMSTAVDIAYMFFNIRNTPSLNISGWDTSNVQKMNSTFFGLLDVLQSPEGIVGIEDIDVSSVTDATFMMGSYSMADGGVDPGIGTIDYDLSSWRFPALTTAKEMFKNNRFIRTLDVTGWGMGNVTNMDSTFETLDYCTAITGLETWNVSNVTNFTQAFINHKVNSGINISGWNMSSATNVTQMLYDCDQFDENLAAWDINQVTTGFDTFMAQASGLSTANYDATLIGWAAQIPLAYNGTINFGGSQYTLGGAAATAHANLVADVGAISDGGGV